MKKKIFIFILVIIIVIVVFKTYDNNYGKPFLENKEIIYANDDIILKQKKIDDKIRKIIKEKHSLDDAQVLLNPYELSPLTALIIFSTNTSEKVDVIINDKKVTTMEKSFDHFIPIYGLKPDYNNKIELKTNNSSKVFEIKTEKYTGNSFNVEKTSNNLEKLYLISTNFTNNRIYDKNGNLMWFIRGDYAGDIEYITNDTFYISDKFQGVNGIKINYPSILKMDYLGKIHEEYVSSYGYHHEIVQLKNNRILVLGNDDNSKYLESNIYILNLKTGLIEKELDMYNVMAKIDKKWVDSFGNHFDFVCNSAEYDEDTGDLLISSRGFNSIIMLNLNTEEIKWIFGNPKLYSDSFKKYLLSYEGNYPSGQHTAHLDGNILTIHNNNYDMFNIKSTIGEYKKLYTAAEMYEIKDNEIRKIWEYDNSKNEFSKVAGAFEILKNGNKLITYGWSISKKGHDKVSLNDEKYLRGIVVELDKDDKVLFRANTKDLIYRTYKVDFYLDETKNYEVCDYKKLSSMDETSWVKTSSIAKKLKNSGDTDIEVSLYNNRISLDGNFQEDDEINIYLVSKRNKTYIYNYKEKDNKEFVNSINVYKNDGLYALYIEVNGNMFDTKKVLNFGV